MIYDNQQPEMTGWIKIEGCEDRPVRALLDSGAKGTYVQAGSHLLEDAIVNQYSNPRTVRMLDGHVAQVKITQFVYASLKPHLSHEPIHLKLDVLPFMGPDILLGDDFLNLNKVILNYKTKTIGFNRIRPLASGTNLIPLGRTRAWGSPTIMMRGTALEYEDVESEDDQLRLQVPPEYHHLIEVFRASRAKSLPRNRPYDHPIDLKTGEKIPPSKVYPLSNEEDKWLKAWIDENLEIKHLRKSQSPFGSPVFLVSKKGKVPYRVVTDYRALNDITIKSSYPIPNIMTLLDRLRLFTIFTKLDLKGAYQLLRIKVGDEHKAAIRTRYGTFDSMVVRDGLCNAPSSFQFFLNDIFHDLLDKGVIIYLDDITIYSTDPKEHEGLVNEVLRRLKEHGLVVSADKCEWSKPRITLLGYIVGGGMLQMDDSKINNIQQWETPQKVYDVQRFIGFANFYRRFINNFSKIVQPLTNLTRKGVPWDWDERCEAAFNTLKIAFTTAPVLRQFDPKRLCVVETDGSDVAIGAVLSQRFPHPTDTGKTELHPIAFWSRTLNPAEKNYTVGEKELLAIIDCVIEWRPYLLSLDDEFTIYTDHKNLTYFQTKRQLNRRQARWYEILADYRYRLVYRPGRLGGLPDALSRRGDYHVGRGSSLDPATNPNNLVQLLPHIEGTNDEIQSETIGNDKSVPVIRGTSGRTEADSFLSGLKGDQGLQMLLETALQVTRSGGRTKDPKVSWTSEGLLLYRGKVVVPDFDDLRMRVTRDAHDATLAGHPGVSKTIALVGRNYYWPGMTTYIAKYVKSCEDCGRHKVRRHKPYGKLESLPVPFRPWTELSMDFIGPLPESNGMNAILVVVDRFTKGAHFIGTTTEATSEDVASMIIKDVVSKHGLPKTIVSDRGTEFTSGFWRNFTAKLNIKSNYSTAYHPQTDGQTERINQILEEYLALYTNYQMDDWSRLLPIAEMVYNNTPSSTTGLSPFMADHGYEMTFDPATFEKRPFSTDSDRIILDISKLHTILREHIILANDRMAKQYNKNHLPVPDDFNIGKKVYLSTRNLTTERPSAKLESRYVGPFTIMERIGPNAIKLDLPPTMRNHPVFNVNLLETHIENEIPNRHVPPPPPVVIDDEEEYIVDRIVDSKRIRGRLMYRVEWKGYKGRAKYDWIEAEGNEDLEAIDHFYNTYPTKPGGPNERTVSPTTVSPTRRKRNHH